MPKLLLAAIAAAILLLIPASSKAQETNAQLTGSVAYRERMALPSDAVIDVQLLDTSIADVVAQTVAEVLINAEGRQVPVPFTLTYDPAKVEPAHRYSVRGTIRSGDGMLMFSSTQAYPVLTHGAPSKVNLILHTVGHGAKTGAAAKEQAAPTTAESVASASQSVPRATSESAPPVTTMGSPASEPAPGATQSAQEVEKPAPQAEAKPAQIEGAAGPPSSTPQESAAPTTPPTESTTGAPTAATESAPSGTAPPTGESSARTPAPESTPTPAVTALPSPATTEQQAPPAEPPAPEVPTPQPQSKSAEAQTPEQSAPSESKTEHTTPTPAAKASEREAPLPEAPSASKRGELAAAAPESAEPEAESTSRPERPAPNKALTPLADTQWKLIQLSGQDVVITPPQKPVTLAFSPEGRRIAGSAGCNSYLGSFTDEQGRLHLNPGSMTMMFCADPAGSRERKFVAMLRSADGYKINGDVLLLTSNGKTVAKFKNNQ